MPTSGGTPDVAGLPWPKGEPGELRAAASKMGRIGSQLRSDGARMVATAGSVSGWRGQAASAYAAGVSEYQNAFATAAGDLTGGAGALRELASDVQDAQDEVRDLAKKVEAAEEAARAARAKATLLAAAAATAQAAASAADVVGFDAQAQALQNAASDAGQAAGSASSTAGSLEAEAARVRARAEQRATELVQRVEAKDASTAGKLRGVSIDAPLGGIGGHPYTGMPSSPLGRVLAPTYAPIYRLDGDEDHFPADYRNSIDGLTPYLDDDGNWVWPLSNDEDMRDGDLPGATLPYIFTLGPNGNLRLGYWRFHHYNDFPGPTVGVDVPAGPFGSVRVEKTIGDAGVGSHDGDWERFGVGFDENGRPENGSYAAHEGSGDVPWDDVEKEDGRPVVYVAHGGHGSYPDPGAHNNPATGIDDQAGGDGETWDTQGNLVDGTTDSRLYEDAVWGDDSSAVVNAPESPGDPDR